jgi:hypothetical protein
LCSVSEALPKRVVTESSLVGWQIAHVYKDHGISGAKGKDKRPQFDALHKAAARREFDVVMAWSVDRLGRSLQDLVSFLSEIHAAGVDLFLHQQGNQPTLAVGGGESNGNTVFLNAVSRPSWLLETRRIRDEGTIKGDLLYL